MSLVQRPSKTCPLDAAHGRRSTAQDELTWWWPEACRPPPAWKENKARNVTSTGGVSRSLRRLWPATSRVEDVGMSRFNGYDGFGGKSRNGQCGFGPVSSSSQPAVADWGGGWLLVFSVKSAMRVGLLQAAFCWLQNTSLCALLLQRSCPGET